MKAQNPKRMQIKIKGKWFSQGWHRYDRIPDSWVVPGRFASPQATLCPCPEALGKEPWEEQGAGRQERPGLLLCILGCSSASITSCWARNHIHFSSQDKAAYNISVIFHPSIQSHTLSICYHQLYCLFQCKQPCSTAFIFPSLSPGFQARGALWKKWDFSQKETWLQAVDFR